MSFIESGKVNAYCVELTLLQIVAALSITTIPDITQLQPSTR